LKTDSDFSFFLGIHIFFNCKGIQNVSLVFGNGIMAELVAQNNTALGTRSQAPLQIFVINWVSLDVSGSRGILGQFKQCIHFISGRLIAHYDKVHGRESVILVEEFLQKYLYRVYRSITEQQKMHGT
jgi:hypothetical protein